MDLYLTLLPMRLVSEANQCEHWAAKARRVKVQRRTVYYWLKHWMPRPPPLPLTITLTRVAPRVLDGDNLISSFKAVIDGCADWLCGTFGGGQDRQEGLVFCYAQRRGKSREYAVEIAVEKGK